MTAGRYTAVFSRLFEGKRRGEYTYPSMGGGSGGSTTTLRRGRPPHERTGREIPFRAFPERCRRSVLETYYALRVLQEERTATVPPASPEGAGFDP
ncbi:MAG: hypothetical protein M3305_04155 [Actinomycetota bacterium]|nr:hypothetical protein [Actinomycetota bacterium]